MDTFLVEHYRAGQDAAALLRAIGAIRAHVAGPSRGSIRYVRSTVVPRDEAFLSILQAESERAVRDAYARAQLSFDRISLAIEEHADTSEVPS